MTDYRGGHLCEPSSLPLHGVGAHDQFSPSRSVLRMTGVSSDRLYIQKAPIRRLRRVVIMCRFADCTLTEATANSSEIRSQIYTIQKKRFNGGIQGPV